MSHPAEPHAVGRRQVEILGGSWTRIQVTIRMRVLDGRPLEPAALRLQGPLARDARADARARHLVTPARVWLEDDVVHVRINIMQGPDRVPFSEGRWRLVLQPKGREPAQLIVAAADGSVDGTEFALARGRYQVEAHVAAGHPVALDVRLGRRGRSAVEVPHDEPETAGDMPPEPLPATDAVRAPARRRRPSGTTLARPLRQLRPWIFHAAFRLMRAVAPRNGRRILFTSDSRPDLGGNLKIVHDRMVERGLDGRYESMFLFKESVAVRRGFLDRLRLPWVLARADVIVLDDYQPVIYRVDERDARIVQLWHAWGAFKTVGYSRVGKPGGLSPWSRVHKNYTYAIVSSEPEVEFYAEAFGIPEDRVRPTGIPRMDGFWDPGRAARSRELALEAYPGARGRFVILFAPTFRGHGARTATYPVEHLDWAALHACCVEKDAVCIVRLHPFVHQALHIPPEFADRIIDGATSSIDINDVLFATDLLVTDYSSVVFEFSTRDKPMLFYAYDLEEYVATRDFYVDYESFVPGRIVRTLPELLDAIRREDYQRERLAAFRARHLDQFDGRATDRVIDLIIGR